MGPKRAADGSSKPVDLSSPIMSAFSFFRSELDEHHDRRERITKASRDITAQSKKIIFSLQRHRALGEPLSPSITADITTRKAEISKLLEGLVPDLSGALNRHRYQRQISPGLQELVEAAVFEHYLTRQRLLPLAEARSTLLPEPLRPALGDSDYLLGIYDATGEIMRFAITGMATGGAIPTGPPPLPQACPGDGDDDKGSTAGNDDDDASLPGRRNVLADLRQLRAALEGLDIKGSAGGFTRECEKKAEVMRHSVEKVETSVYGLIVRGKERPKGWMPDARAELPPREEVEGY